MLKAIALAGWSFLKQGSLRLKAERLRNRFDLLRQSIIVKSHPSILIIDPATMCNLKCPFCSTGNGSLQLKKEILQPDVFEKIVSHLRVKLIAKVHLFNFGEPLLNKHLVNYIRFFSKRGIKTLISTNLSVKAYDDDEIDQLVRSGLSELLVSVDGGTQESYEKYRVGGNLERVLGNLRKINEKRKQLRTSTPRIIYQVLLNKFNQDELEIAREHAASVDADEFRVNENFYIPPDLYEIWTADSIKEKYGKATATVGGRKSKGMINTECRQLWDTILVNANGDVLPCCVIDQSFAAVGNLADQDISEIWNNDKMQTLRRFVTDPTAPEIPFPNLCQNCTHRYCTYNQ